MVRNTLLNIIGVFINVVMVLIALFITYIVMTESYR